MPFILKNKECSLSRQPKWFPQIMEGSLWGNLMWQYILIWQTSQGHWMTLLSGLCYILACPAPHISQVLQSSAQPFCCLQPARLCSLNDSSMSLLTLNVWPTHKALILLLCISIFIQKNITLLFLYGDSFLFKYLRQFI